MMQSIELILQLLCVLLLRISKNSDVYHQQDLKGGAHRVLVVKVLVQSRDFTLHVRCFLLQVVVFLQEFLLSVQSS